MQKHIVLPLLSLMAGGVGFFLNTQLHTTALNLETQLLYPDALAPKLLLALSLVMAILLAIPLLRGNSPQGLEAAIKNPPTATQGLWGLGAALLSVGAGMTLFTCVTQLEQRSQGLDVNIPVTLLLAAALALPVAIGLLTTIKYLSRGQYTSTLAILSLFPPCCVLPWVLNCYQQNTKNPVVALYGYQLVALSVAAIAFYQLSSLSYSESNKCRPRCTAYASLLGCYLLLASLVWWEDLYIFVTQLAFAAILLGNASVILKNIYAPRRRERLHH